MAKSVNRHLVAVLTFIGLLPLVYYIPPAIAQWISPDHLVVTVLAVAIIVPLISYLWMPLALKAIYTISTRNKK